MALGDSRVIKGEPCTVVFELNCAKTPETGRKLQMVVYKLEKAEIWIFVINDFYQESFASFSDAIDAALSYIGKQSK